MYKIKYTYETGNSFGRETTSDILEFEFNNLELAQENLQRIKEHYEQYRETDGYMRRNANEIYEQNKNKDWFVETKNYYHSRSCLKLKLDNGKFVQFWAPWCGYFETLYSAEIVLPPIENKNKIEF